MRVKMEPDADLDRNSMLTFVQNNSVPAMLHKKPTTLPKVSGGSVVCRHNDVLGLEFC